MSVQQASTPCGLGLEHQETIGSLPVRESGRERCDPERRTSLPLKTPDRRLLPAEASMFEVRKRLASPPGSDEEAGDTVVDGKRRLVAKTLFGSRDGGFPRSGMNLSRSLFGSPGSEDDNRALLESFENKVTQAYEEFSKRYIIVEEIS